MSCIFQLVTILLKVVRLNNLMRSNEFFYLNIFQVDALGNSSVNPRTKRALYHRYGHCRSSKLSVKDLALELDKAAHKSHLLMILSRNFIKPGLLKLLLT